MTERPVIMWFREDLRLADNPALHAAAAEGPVICVYILDDEAAGDWAPGAASRWWLDRSLAAITADLHRRHCELVLRRGRAEHVLAELVDETGAAAVHAAAAIEPWAREQEKRVQEASPVALRLYQSRTLYPLDAIRTDKGTPYKVFSPFWRQLQRLDDPVACHDVPAPLSSPDRFPESESRRDWNLAPDSPDWASEIAETWPVGEAAAMARLNDFLDEGINGYRDGRDFPGKSLTSRLSPYLHFGEISPRQVWHICRDRQARRKDLKIGDVQSFLRELAWREFAYHLLVHMPELPDAPMKPEFADFDWSVEGNSLQAWQEGRTGYPIVDAGMRQLWRTGWMHNRVRMIAASFLIKDQLIHWRTGERWFWDTLVDADLANNAMGWQWVAGCGPDAAPYFRIFNPVTQSRRFDPDGVYIRHWVPELAALPNDAIHAPWDADQADLDSAGIRLGKTYPKPILDHGIARDRALAAYRDIKDNVA